MANGNLLVILWTTRFLVYMNKLYIISFLLLLSACISSNDDFIKDGKNIIYKFDTRLEGIIPICDSIFVDSCNVFYILTSPTTDLFAQGAEIDELYYKGCMLEATDQQSKAISDSIVRPELSRIGFMKGVYVSFGMSYVNHGDEGIKLVKILDKVKFDELFNLLLVTDKRVCETQYNWIYPVNNDWYIVSGSLVKSGC